VSAFIVLYGIKVSGTTSPMHLQVQGIIGYTAQFGPFDGMLDAKEVRTIQGAIISDLRTIANAWQIGGITTLVQVTLNGVVLDELYTYLS
jgi:hypothetical protein